MVGCWNKSTKEPQGSYIINILDSPNKTRQWRWPEKKEEEENYTTPICPSTFPDQVNAFLNASGGEIWKTTTNRTVEYCGFSTRSKRNGSIKWFGREMEETNKTPKLAWWMLLIGAANNHLRDCRRQRERNQSWNDPSADFSLLPSYSTL